MHGARSANDMENLVLYLDRVLSPKMYERLMRIRDPSLHRWIARIISIARPSSVYILTSDEDDAVYVRRAAIERREELPTKYPMHTVHFDGINDLARDRKNTRILLPHNRSIPFLNTYDREMGIAEIFRLAEGIMEGKEMFVAFYCFGPRNSDFTMYAVQVTDSAYVIHSENILYRPCYDVFVEKAPHIEYVKFFHSAGELDENNWSKNVNMRRIYIDVVDSAAYSINTQYAGNSVGLKKLMLRMCIYRGCREGWLCEHMFIVGVRGNGDRITYFTDAFPAGCGKTSTVFAADTIVGDDIAIIKAIDGVARAVNPEVGMFGIIDDINPADDPALYQLLTSPETEVIFTNVLLTDDGEVWWRGKPEPPKPGINYAGRCWPGKGDGGDNEVPLSHPNARFTMSIRYLNNLDPRIDDPNGVPIQGMIFGGRDYHTLPPVVEAFNWIHGIITMGGALESEKTAAILDGTSEMEFNPFAVLDFLPISIGRFLELHLDFSRKLSSKPRIFNVNYFLKDENGRFIAGKSDKRVWLKWMELRVHGDIDAVETPIGYIPIYSDLAKLFDRYLGKEYSEARYEKEFTIMIASLISKIERLWNIYSAIPDTPPILFETLRIQKKKLEEARSSYGDKVKPFKFSKI
ncbi:MAG: phosphoenolpyruvate carboxykinase (GTP) [Ignisphaera sp.]